MPDTPIHLLQAFERLRETWSPRVVAQMNDVCFKIARLQGEFTWHRHEDTDEAFLVLEGSLRIELRGSHVELAAGELFVVPKGVEHRPVARAECKVLLVEPQGVVNTGGAGGEQTAPVDKWL